MRPSMFMGARGLTQAEFVGVDFQQLTGYEAPISLAGIPGLRIGDYVLITCATPFGSGYFTTSAAGWDADNYIFTNRKTTTFRRRINSLAPVVIANTATDVAAGVMISAYRGASSAARVSVTWARMESTSAPFVIPGFVRRPDAVGIASIIIKRSSVGPGVVAPTDWALRGHAAPVSFSGFALADALARATYVDGAPIIWSGLSDNTSGMVWELRA